MNYLVENMTRAPSQVLVRSASTFGEEAAKVLGKIIEESLKNCTNDITTCIKDCTTIVSKKLGKSVSGFGQTFKETGIEGFTEWGIGIERAFYHLGQKLETGLYNASGRVVSGMQETVDKSVDRVDEAVRDGTRHVSDHLLMKQVPAWKSEFQRELNIVLGCAVLICASLFIWSMCTLLSLLFVGGGGGGGGNNAYYAHYPYTASSSRSNGVELNGTSSTSSPDSTQRFPVVVPFVSPLSFVFNALFCVVFASLIGYALYIWDNKSKVVAAKSSDSSVSNEENGRGGDSTRKPNERSLTPSTNDISRILENPKVLLFIVGSIGFFAGTIGQQITSQFNSFLLLVLLVLVATIVYQAFTFQVSYQVFKWFKKFQQFREWEKQQQQSKASTANQ